MHDVDDTAAPARGELVPVAPLDLLEIGAAARVEAGVRARQLPYLATAGTLAAGWAGWGGAELAGWLGGDPAQAVTSITCLGLSGLAVGVLRLRYRRGIRREWSRRWWVSAAAAAAWVDVAVVTSPASWGMTAALAAGAAGLSVRWLREHAVPQPGAPETPLELSEDLGAVLARKWVQRVGSKGGVIPGAVLTNRRDLPHAIQWTVQTIPGSVTFADMFQKRGLLATAFNVRASKLVLEHSDEDEGHAELTVIVRDVLAAGVPYTGPLYQDGRISVGLYADGTGWGEYVAVDEVGCRNGLATGDPGSGKTAFLENVAMGLRASGCWRVVFGDGDPEAGSSPLLNELAHRVAAGPERVLRQMEGIEALIGIRSLLKATLTAGPDKTPVPITDPSRQRPVREMRPSPAWPGYCWVIDELHRLTTDPWLVAQGFVKRLEKIVRIGRKYGVVVLAGTQSLLAGDFGNSTALRGYLATRNLFAFRSANKSEKAVVGGLEISPGVLPKGGGYAFAAESGRLSMLRVAWSPTMAEWIPTLPACGGDADSELAIAPFMPAGEQDPAAELASRVARLDEWRAARGRPPAATEAAPAGSHPLLAGVRIPAPLTGDNVVPMRRGADPMAGLYDDQDLEALTGTQRAVYEQVRNGRQRTGEIADAAGLQKPATSKALGALADLGLVHRIAHGRHGLGPAPAETG